MNENFLLLLLSSENGCFDVKKHLLDFFLPDGFK